MFRAVATRSSKRTLSNKRFNSHIPPPQASSAEAVPENFSSPIWRNTLAFGALSYSIYKFDQAYATSHDGLGYFSGVIDYYRAKEGLWESRNIRHFDLGKEAAASRLLLQSAQKPEVRQLRYPAALDHGSPWNTRVDHTVDTSAVKVKRHNQVAVAGVEDSV